MIQRKVWLWGYEADKGMVCESGHGLSKKVQEGDDVKLEQFTKWIEFNRRWGRER